MPTGERLRYYSGEFKRQIVETAQKKPNCHEAARWERHYLQQGISGPYLEHRVKGAVPPDWSEYAMPRPPHPKFESANTIQSS